LDADKVVAEYLALAEPETSPPPAALSSRRAGAGGKRRGWLGMVVALAIIGVVAYWGLDRSASHPAGGTVATTTQPAVTGAAAGSTRGAPQPPATPRRATRRAGAAPTAKRPLPASQPVAHAATGTVVQSQPPAANSNAAPPANSAANAGAPQLAATVPAASVPVRIVVTASASAWVKLTSGGNTVTVATLAPGQQLSYSLAPPVDLITGNAGATQVSVNGQAQPALGAAGAIVLWRYPPGSVRSLPAAGAKPAATPGPAKSGAGTGGGPVAPQGATPAAGAAPTAPGTGTASGTPPSSAPAAPGTGGGRA
jgi:hypothetical protein